MHEERFIQLGQSTVWRSVYNNMKRRNIHLLYEDISIILSEDISILHTIISTYPTYINLSIQGTKIYPTMYDGISVQRPYIYPTHNHETRPFHRTGSETPLPVRFWRRPWDGLSCSPSLGASSEHREPRPPPQPVGRASRGLTLPRVQSLLAPCPPRSLQSSFVSTGDYRGGAGISILIFMGSKDFFLNVLALHKVITVGMRLGCALHRSFPAEYSPRPLCNAFRSAALAGLRRGWPLDFSVCFLSPFFVLFVYFFVCLSVCFLVIHLFIWLHFLVLSSFVYFPFLVSFSLSIFISCFFICLFIFLPCFYPCLLIFLPCSFLYLFISIACFFHFTYFLFLISSSVYLLPFLISFSL